MSSNYQSFSVVGINLRVVWLCRNSEQKFHQTGFSGKWYYQSIRHKTEIGKVEKFEKFEKYGMENSVRNIRKNKKSGMQIPTSNPSHAKGTVNY